MTAAHGTGSVDSDADSLTISINHMSGTVPRPRPISP